MPERKRKSFSKSSAPPDSEAKSGFRGPRDLLAIPAQVRLLRLIQTGDFYRENTTKVLCADVTIIAASHHDLTQEYYKKMFSRDLLYHRMTNSLRIPALQHRPGDIPLLADYFVKVEAKAKGKKIAAVAPELMVLLKHYDFPDNIREQRNIVAAAVADEDGETLTLDSLPHQVRDTLTRAVDERTKGFRPRALAEIEREHIEKTLAYFSHERAKAAEALGLSEEAMDAVLGDPDHGLLSVMASPGREAFRGTRRPSPFYKQHEPLPS